MAASERFDRAARRKVERAITEAEIGSRAEIRVHVEARFPGDGPLARARELFHALGMDRTREGTGVLLYVALADRRAAVWAGPGLVGASAPDFWARATALVADGFRAGDGAGGIAAALAAIGELARAAAPGDDAAGNELPDKVTFGALDVPRSDGGRR